MRGLTRGIAAAALLVLAGCSSGAAHPKAPAASGPHAAEQLLGTWRVSSEHVPIPHELPETIQIGGSPDGLVITRSCGVVNGTWRATDGGAFATYVDPNVPACNTHDMPYEPVWVFLGWSYRLAGNELEILSDDGTVMAVMARLSTAARPISTELRDALATPAAVPHGLTPVTKPNQVGGNWVPTSGAAKDDALSLLGNDYMGFFGKCNFKGEFAYDNAGVFISAGPNVTGPDCASVPVARWIARTTRLALDHGKLAFIDRAGHMLGELSRATP